MTNWLFIPRIQKQSRVESERTWRVYSGRNSSSSIQSSILGVMEADCSDVLCPFLTVVKSVVLSSHLTRHFLCCGFDWRWSHPFSEPIDYKDSGILPINSFSADANQSWFPFCNQEFWQVLLSTSSLNLFKRLVGRSNQDPWGFMYQHLIRSMS
jgi:hypothetical protein